MGKTKETYHFTIGSSSGCDLEIKHSSVARAHAKIYYSGESILIEDLQSSSGTFVLYNGEFKKVKSAKIKPETIIRFGSTLEGIPVGKLIDDYQLILERDKKDITKKVKSIGLKRCKECGSVMSKSKIHCECCGAIFDETA